MKKFLKIIIPICIICGIAAAIFYYYHSNKTRFNTSYVNGNTAGNLYNSGLFAESADGTIYFSNFADHHYLYAMDNDGGNIRKLLEEQVEYINADDNYVYYVRNSHGQSGPTSFLQVNTNSLCRYSIRTKKVLILDEAPCTYVSLIGNYIYYIHYDTETASSLYRIKIDGTEKQQIDANPYFTCSTNQQYLYYNGLDSDHNIYQMDTSLLSVNQIMVGNYWMPDIKNDTGYYIDVDDNYALYRVNASDGTKTKLTNQKVESYNVFGNYIYFTGTSSDGVNGLFCVQTDGTNEQLIRQGDFTNINIAGNYAYFTQYNDDNTIFRTLLGGNGEITTFAPTAE